MKNIFKKSLQFIIVGLLAFSSIAFAVTGTGNSGAGGIGSPGTWVNKSDGLHTVPEGAHITVGSCTGCGGGGGGGGTVTSVGLTLGTFGTNPSVTGSPITGAGSFTLNLPSSSTTNRGLLTSTDWDTFNNKVSTGLLTGSGLTMNTNRLLGRTTGSAGAVEEITVGSGLTFSGTNLAVDGSIVSGLLYKGTWNANTNTPTLASGVGTTGDLYIVSVAGTTTLDGISSWSVGDFLFFNGTIWQQIAATNLTNIIDGTTPTTGFGASEILFSDGSVVRGNSKFTYNPTTNLFQVTDGTDRFLRISPGSKTFAIGDLDGAGPYIESNLSSNELQLVANILEFGGNRYTWPGTQGTAGQVLAVDSVALGVATLDWTDASSLITGDPNSVPYFDGTGALQATAGKISYVDSSAEFFMYDTNGNPNFYSDGTGQQIVLLDAFGAYGTGFAQFTPTLVNMGGDFGGGQGSTFIINYGLGKAALGDVSGLLTGDSLNLDFLNSQFDIKNGNGRLFTIDLLAGRTEIGDPDFVTTGLLATFDNASELFQVASGGNSLFQVNGSSRVILAGDISNSFGSGLLTIDYDNNIMSWDNASRFDINGQVMSWPASTAAGVLTNDGAGNLTWAGGSGISTIGTLDGNTPGVNGASIVTSSLFMQSASSSRPGLVNNTTQVFSGLKAFSTGLEMSAGAVTATGGAGYLDFFTQSSTPAAPSTSFLRLWQQSNRFFFSRNGGIDASLDFNAITSDRNFAFPDVAGTVVVYSATAATATGGAVTPPAQVEGYITIQVGGVNKKIPYYAN